MTEPAPDHAEEALGDLIDNAVPTHGYQMTPLVGLGGSAGAIPALQAFLKAMPPDSGQAFVVVLHLPHGHVSSLAEILQRSTTMPVSQVDKNVPVAPNNVYVIPPGKLIKSVDGELTLTDDPAPPPGRRMTVDHFFRTLADTHGPHAAAVVLSGADGDGAIGIKRIKERGGLTVAQDPQEAEHASMPRSAIATGMVDWVLPVAAMGARLLKYFALEKDLKLPPEDGPPPAQASSGSPHSPHEEAALREVLGFLRARTGRDFSCYKRATVVRRIARRMQVNGVENLQAYLECLRTRSGEAGALLQDLLISVTNFFRDPDAFDALDAQLDALFKDKGPNDTIRVWVAACATGEEAYSLAILLAEKARLIEAPPVIQLFATDLDEQAIRAAREGSYPSTIEADVPEDLLRRYFVKGADGYRVRRELRESVLFAQHDLLRDSPFSRLDLVSCRNLLIYLGRDAQQRLFDIFHFALLPQGRLFLGSSESAEEAGALFEVLDKKNRIFERRPARAAVIPLPVGPGTLALALEAQQHELAGPSMAARALQHTADRAGQPPLAGRKTSWGELHFKLLETLAPPSILVDGEYDIVHMSTSAGRFLQYSGGEPSKSILRAVHSGLRIELRAALYQAAQTQATAEALVSPVDLGGEARAITIRVSPVRDLGSNLFIVTFSDQPVGSAAQPDAAPPQRVAAEPVARHLELELERVKNHLRDTVEEYETSNEELKASNEELQAMNEELRSATEELETSREELQSINEELTTVNQELKSNVDELSRANSDIHNLMDATAIATVFLDRELRITRYTPAAVALFNLIATDLGRPLADLATRLDYPQLGTDARRVLEVLVPVEREVGLADGQWFLSRLRPYRTMDDHIGGVVASFIDITEQKRAAEALRSSEERLRMLVENAGEFAVFSTDLQRRITTWNSGAQRLLGYAEAEVLGRPADIIFTEEERAAGAPEHEMEQALVEGRAGDDRFHRRKDGGRFWASGALMLMRDAKGQAVGFVKILRDQTAALEHQQALERSRAELVRALAQNEAARSELQVADAAKDRFLAVLSHELRNPLASIHGAAALMQVADLPADKRDAAGRLVERQAHAMKMLLDDLLDVSRLKLGRLELHRQTVLLSDVVLGAVESIRPALEEARHPLSVELPDGPVELDADPLRLGQVVSNLLDNAIKYTPARGRIALKARLAGEEAQITVTDDGVGMEPAQIGRIFDMFTQTHNRDQGGLGIGLALAKSIVERHGGRIEALSQGLGRGSEFRVFIPARRAAAPAQPSTELGAAVPAALEPGKRGLILIADDNADASWGIAKLLEIAGFDTVVVDSGQQALAEAARRKPDIGIIDIGMPDLDGHEVARRIREAEWGKRMGLIAATGWGQESDEREALAAGFDAHMTKPVDLRKLGALVNDLLLRKRA